MARIRTIKPEFWTSEQVMELSPLSRLLLIGMWNFCDDAGIHPASLKTLKAKVFPADDVNAEQLAAMVQEWLDQGLVTAYEAEGKSFFQVTGWHHQKIDKPNYKYPHPICDDSANGRRMVGEASPSVHPRKGRGEEGKGKDNNSKSDKSDLSLLDGASSEPPTPPPPESSCKKSAKRGKRLTPDWELPTAWGKWAESKGLSRDDVIRESEKFRDYWVSVPGQKGVKLDWEATWRNWIRTHLEGFRR